MIVLYGFATLVALLGPVVASILVVRRLKVEWQALIFGMVAYIGGDIILRLIYTGLDQVFAASFSQMQDVLLMTFLAALIYGVATSLGSVGVKWLVFRFFRNATNSWNRALVVGLGYGSFEVILSIGLPLVFALITFLTYNGQDLAGMGLTAEQATQAQEFLTSFQTQPVNSILTYLVQPVLQIVLHILTAILVWYALSQKKYIWLAAAFGWMALVTIAQVFLFQVSLLTETDSPVWLVWLVFTIFTIWLIRQTRRKMYTAEA